MQLTKKQLKKEELLLRELICRFGGEISLLNAHDRVSVELDYLRGDCEMERSKFINILTKLWGHIHD